MSPQKKEEIKDVEQGIKAINQLLEKNKAFIGKDYQAGGMLAEPGMIIRQVDQLLKDTYKAASDKGPKKVETLGPRIKLANLHQKLMPFIPENMGSNKLFDLEIYHKVTSALKEGKFDGYAPGSNHRETFTPRSSSTPRERSSSPGLSSSDSEDKHKMLSHNKTKRK